MAPMNTQTMKKVQITNRNMRNQKGMTLFRAMSREGVPRKITTLIQSGGRFTTFTSFVGL